MSIFHARLFQRRFNVPLIAFEHVEYLQKNFPEYQIDIPRLISQFCGVLDPTKEDVDYFVGRFKQKEGTEDQSEKSKKEKITRGSSFRKFISSLPTDQILVLACNMDYEKAKKYYEVVDKEDAIKIISLWIEYTLETHNLSFESVLYGFGGGYTDNEVEDISDMDIKDIAKLLGANYV
jgi:hypothetical protein